MVLVQLGREVGGKKGSQRPSWWCICGVGELGELVWCVQGVFWSSCRGRNPERILEMVGHDVCSSSMLTYSIISRKLPDLGQESKLANSFEYRVISDGLGEGGCLWFYRNWLGGCCWG